jgi:hypothetical protein
MRCKQGDLALIIKSVDDINTGKIVDVLEYVGEHTKHGASWHVRSRGTDLILEDGTVSRESHCSDDSLKPLPPDAPADANDDGFPIREPVMVRVR